MDSEKKMKMRYEIYNECNTFYALELMQSALFNTNPYQHSIERFRQDLEPVRKKHLDGIYAALRDYLTLACFGEARHAPSASNRHISGININTSSRSAFSLKATDFDPLDLTTKMVDLFQNSRWNRSYGGSSWGRIAEAAMHFWLKDWPATVLIDHSFDLAHNNGICFNKGFIFYFDSGDYMIKRFLTKKTQNTSDQWPILHVPEIVGKLLDRAAVLGLIPETKWVSVDGVYVEGRRILSILVDGYEPMEYGTSKVGPVTGKPIEHHKDTYDEEDDDSDSDDDEDDSEEEEEMHYTYNHIPQIIPAKSRDDATVIDKIYTYKEVQDIMNEKEQK
jgi:hypothetical protein